jgi:hypothetical protein
MKLKLFIIFFSMFVLILCTFSATALQAGTPKISVTPMSVNFGGVKLGGTSARAITVKNTGTSRLVINNINITGPNASEFSQTNSCAAIPAGSSCTVTATFNPTLLPFGQKTATLSISSNDPKKPTVNVNLSGSAPPPKISISASSVNFGSVQAGKVSSPKRVTIKNTGTSDLVISSINITGPNASQFSQINNCATIPTGGSCTITLTFAPTSMGSKSATLSISSNDPKNPTLSVKLLGNATAPAQGTGVWDSSKWDKCRWGR